MNIMRYLRGPRLWLPTLLVILVLAIAAVATGCGSNSAVGDGGTVSTTSGTQTTVTIPPEDTTTTTESPEPSSTTTTAKPAEETMKLKVYFSRDEKICALTRELPKTDAVGTAAVKALLQGPTAEEKEFGVFSNIPSGTTF